MKKQNRRIGICLNCGKKEKEIVGQGLCKKCYQKAYRERTLPPRKLFINKGKICKAEGCNNPAKIKGYCPKHNYRNKTYGNPLIGKNVDQHGYSHTYLYNVWKNRMHWCYNKNNRDYKYYGNRGIKLYQPFINNFLRFVKYILKDIGEKPSKNATLDKIINNASYYPGNFRWASQTIQNRNKRNSIIDDKKAIEIKRLYYIEGYKQKEIAKKYNTCQTTISYTINKRKVVHKSKKAFTQYKLSDTEIQRYLYCCLVSG